MAKRKKQSDAIRINCAYCKHGGEEYKSGFMYPCEFLTHYVVGDWGKCLAEHKGGYFILDEKKVPAWTERQERKRREFSNQDNNNKI